MQSEGDASVSPVAEFSREHIRVNAQHLRNSPAVLPRLLEVSFLIFQIKQVEGQNFSFNESQNRKVR